MNPSGLIGCLLIIALPSCAASPESLWSKFSRSTGLLDGLLTIVGVRKDVALIKICPGSGQGGGYISAARAVAASRGVEIYGNVQNSFGYEAPLHAHVDIFFRLKDGRIIPGRAVDYFPRIIPSATRGSIPLSHFFAEFDALPEQTDTVLLYFHRVEKSQCDLAIPKDCKRCPKKPQH
jgi:hypothetical protein